MMPRKDEIRVRVTAYDAGACARWLRDVYLPARAGRPDTALTPGFNVETYGLLDQLAVILSRSAVRKRSGTGPFTINIRRQTVERFAVAVYDSALPNFADRIVAAMKAAALGRRGRPSLSSAMRAVRIATTSRLGEHAERHRKRLVRQQRIDAARSAWADEVRARGETVLTTSLPLPEI